MVGVASLPGLIHGDVAEITFPCSHGLLPDGAVSAGGHGTAECGACGFSF